MSGLIHNEQEMEGIQYFAKGNNQRVFSCNDVESHVQISY